MSRIELVSKNLLANYFRKSNKDFPCQLKTFVTNIVNNKINEIQHVEKEDAKKGPEMSANIA